MIVTVTQQDIDLGIRTDCQSCPVALAVSRLFPECYIRVTSSYVRIVYPDKSELILRPSDEGSQFVTDFDRQAEVKPISFTLTSKEWHPANKDTPYPKL